MEVNIYVDESGDLGWKFDKPYRNGGSSRFFTLGFIIVPIEKKHLLARVNRQFRKKYPLKPNQELKGSALSKAQREFFCELCVKMISKNEDIILGTVTINKENVDNHIRDNKNVLFNYALGKGVLSFIKHCNRVNLYPDQREIKVKQARSCADYLQSKLLFEFNSKAIIHYQQCDSKHNQYVRFIDKLTNTIWQKHESGHRDAFRIVNQVLKEKLLYFGSK